ncbi:hypothetical protein EVAR_91372_1 [Eumeta japonica]|uniref:Uncharacterized protein n=1 Tax=Eumeta variegata TaxID=151549 RepID=A0A4C1XDF6_EUMVA|nr:hypothetical protein EVAR_91372_1 [Eumeta japonica]
MKLEGVRGRSRQSTRAPAGGREFFGKLARRVLLLLRVITAPASEETRSSLKHVASPSRRRTAVAASPFGPQTALVLTRHPLGPSPASTRLVGT